MSFRAKILIAVVLAAVLWCGRLAWDYFDPQSPAHMAIQYELKAFGSAMYEYHSATGRWPTALDDLAQTTLPQRSPMWRQTAIALALLWPKDLQPDPRDNGAVLLAYDKGGLFNNLGRAWVCWGDLRTEHVREQDLRARLPR